MNRSGLLFVSWQPHCSRSDNIARELGGRSFMVYSPRWGRSKVSLPFRWISQVIKTLALLYRERPAVVFVMTPPVVACLPIFLYARLARISYVIDAHSGAFIDERWRRVLFLHKLASRGASATIVTNQALKEEVESWGGQALTITDVPVEFDKVSPAAMSEDFQLVMPASFTHDEPIEAVTEAARHLPDVRIVITGDTRRAPKDLLDNAPHNVTFTGFLSEAEYGGLLQGADAVLALTTYDHTMQRGAYEAVYMGRPVITSNFQILRDSFNKGAVFVDATSDDIRRGIKKMIGEHLQYKREVQILRDEKLERWKEVLIGLRKTIGESDGGMCR